jgi:hypoxanthine phosphoribosyltransferase
MIEKCYVSWNEIDELVNSLTQQIAQSGIQFENIFGLQRGGLIPAVMVSHKLGIPMTKGTISPNTLIIDDICDSGVTFANFFEMHQKEYAFPFNLNFACLHYKPQTSKFKPTFYSSIWNSNDWIVYPWEREDSNTIQDYKF